MQNATSIFGDGPWESRLENVMQLLLALNGTSDPREMNAIITDRVSETLPRDRTLVATRRGVERPKFIITRYSEWGDDAPDPWTQREKLPVLEGGFIWDLFEKNACTLINDVKLDPDDPAYPYLNDAYSVLCFPTFEGTESSQLQVTIRDNPPRFEPDIIPELLWSANLYARAIHNLRLGEELREAYRQIDREFEIVSGIQYSLLPKTVPKIEGAKLAVFYNTAQRAGGDYYDFLPLADGRIGILIADVCGHGPSAAVLMAITHAITHTSNCDTENPSAYLQQVNEALFEHYTHESKSFVTAFYGILDPRDASMVYARAGHEPARWKRKGEVVHLLGEATLPLGVESGEIFPEERVQFSPGEALVLTTDGIAEAQNRDEIPFDSSGVDAAISEASSDAESIQRHLLESLSQHVDGLPAVDDQTLVVLVIDK